MLITLKFYIQLSFSYDATEDDGSLGRFINDSRYFVNAIMKKTCVMQTPYLCLYALENIPAETEISYFYGVDQPWHNQVIISV